MPFGYWEQLLVGVSAARARKQRKMRELILTGLKLLYAPLPIA